MGRGMGGSDSRSLCALRGAPLQDVVMAARLDLAGALSEAIASQSLGPRAYLRWIAAERVLCAAGAEALRAMAPGLPAVGDWARAAAEVLAGQAAMAAADLRRTQGMAPATGLLAVDHWRDYLDLHARLRPGLAMGAIALHAGATGGATLSAALELPFLPLRGATYLVHRQLQAKVQTDAVGALWHLADARLQRDLVAGAAHAATLYRGILQAAFDLPATADQARWRWPGERAG